MAVHIYRKAFAHVANKPFRTDPEGGEIRPLPTTFLAGLRRLELGCVAQTTTASWRPSSLGCVLTPTALCPRGV